MKDKALIVDAAFEEMQQKFSSERNIKIFGAVYP